MQRILSGLIALLVLFTSTVTYAEREDVPAAGGQDATAILGVRNDTGAAQTSTDGDWGYLAIDSAGRMQCTMPVGTGSFVKAEDGASTTSDPLAIIGVQRADTEGDTTNTDGDYATLHETDGRLSITNRDRILTTTLDTSSTSNFTSSLNIDGMSTCSFFAARTSETGSLNFQVSVDGTNYVNVQAMNITQNQPDQWNTQFGTNGQILVSNTANPFSFPCAGFKSFRVKVSSAGAGTLPVYLRASPGTNVVAVAGILPGVSATALGKSEDAPHASGDVGVAVFSVRQVNPDSSFTGGTDGDYQLLKSNSLGAAFADIRYDAQASSALGLLKKEDLASADQDAGVPPFAVYNTTPTQGAGTVGDYSFLQNDAFGALWVRPAPNQDVTSSLVTCSGCTTTQTGSDQVNYSGKCATVVLDMTTVGTGSVTLEIDGKDVVSGKYFALLTGAAVTTNSTNVYQLCPGVTVAANAAVSAALPKTWRVKVTANNANATTYTVGASIIE